MSLRAAIRAKVEAANVAHLPPADGARRAERTFGAPYFLSSPRCSCRPPRPRLVVIGGLSGTGRERARRRARAPQIGRAPGAADAAQRRRAQAPVRRRRDRSAACRLAATTSQATEATLRAPALTRRAPRAPPPVRASSSMRSTRPSPLSAGPRPNPSPAEFAQFPSMVFGSKRH